MIRINNTAKINTAKSFSYIEKRNFLARFIMPITRFLRTHHALKYLSSESKTHLDIGCGDCYFLKRSPCKERIGIDKLYGDDAQNTLNFDDNYFDCITMLAVIEHFEDPLAVIKECKRILKPNGKLIITTPKKSGEIFMRLYSKDIEDEHNRYFDFNSMQKLVGPYFTIKKYKTFLFGLNQVFVLEGT